MNFNKHIFKDNKYTNVYYKIIQNAKDRKEKLPIKERHHIIPKSMGGTNDAFNIVELTPKEHFICHRLLVKMAKNPKHVSFMKYALWCMSNRKSITDYIKITAKVYDNIRTNYVTEKRNSMQGEKNHFYGKTHTHELKKWFSENNPAKRPEVREKMRGKRGVMPHNHYDGWSEEVKKKISESLKGHKHSDEFKINCSKKRKGNKWIHKTNPYISKFVHANTVAGYLQNGWVLGRGPKNLW